MDPIGVLLVCVGVFSVLAAALEWGFFIRQRKVQQVARYLGHQGMRVFYVVLGLFCMVFGGLMVTGVVNG